MSTDLQAQIREMARVVEASQDPVTVDEVRLLVEGRDDTEPLVGPAPTARRLPLPRRPWPAVVAAVVVLLLFGALAWMVPSGETTPPADSVPSPFESEQGFYTTSAVPDGFVLQDLRNIGGSNVLFLREFEDTWIPTDGGFAIHGIHGHPAGVREDPAGYLDETLTAVPGSTEVEVAGRGAILYETQFNQDGLTAPLIWVLGIDDQGGVFELAAVGMSRDEVLAVADGVQRIPVDEFVSLGSEITWDVRVGVGHSGFTYSPPVRATELADDLDVALGVDLLLSRLAFAGGDTTVVTTDDGEIVETFGQAVRSTSAALFLDVPQAAVEAALRAYPGTAELSPEQRDARIDRYVEQLRGGQVLSEEPYVIQAVRGPEPRFDTSQLGEELPLLPATSTDVLPEFMFTGTSRDRAAATEGRPVIIIGTAQQPNSDTPAVTVLVWFTETGDTCASTAFGEGMGSACGFEILSRFGGAGESTEESSQGVFGELSYVVPLETSVVQIVTRSQTYWQLPIGGYGIVPFGDTVERPTTIIAYDADGNEIDGWRVGVP